MANDQTNYSNESQPIIEVSYWDKDKQKMVTKLVGLYDHERQTLDRTELQEIITYRNNIKAAVNSSFKGNAMAKGAHGAVAQQEENYCEYLKRKANEYKNKKAEKIKKYIEENPNWESEYVPGIRTTYSENHYAAWDSDTPFADFQVRTVADRESQLELDEKTVRKIREQDEIQESADLVNFMPDYYWLGGTREASQLYLCQKTDKNVDENTKELISLEKEGEELLKQREELQEEFRLANKIYPRWKPGGENHIIRGDAIMVPTTPDEVISKINNLDNKINLNNEQKMNQHRNLVDNIATYNGINKDTSTSWSESLTPSRAYVDQALNKNAIGSFFYSGLVNLPLGAANLNEGNYGEGAMRLVDSALYFLPAARFSNLAKLTRGATKAEIREVAKDLAKLEENAAKKELAKIENAQNRELTEKAMKEEREILARKEQESASVKAQKEKEALHADLACSISVACP